MAATTGEHAIRQCHRRVNDATVRAQPGGGVPAVSFDKLPAAPRLFVFEKSSELRPAGVGNRAGQPVIVQHPCHVQIFDDEPVVGLD
jgi:hypothetical protein